MIPRCGVIYSLFTDTNNVVIVSEYANTYLYQYEYRMSLSTYPDWAIADHGQEVPLMIGKYELCIYDRSVYSYHQKGEVSKYREYGNKMNMLSVHFLHNVIWQF